MEDEIFCKEVLYGDIELLTENISEEDTTQSAIKSSLNDPVFILIWVAVFETFDPVKKNVIPFIPKESDPALATLVRIDVKLMFAVA